MKNPVGAIVTSVCIASIIGALTACESGQEKGQQTGSSGITLPFTQTMRITGAGASFPAPLYQNWFVLLGREVSQLQFDFQSVGSGAGIERFTQNVIDFGASDVAMTDEQIKKVNRGVLMLPMTAGSVVIAYNLPEVKELKLSRKVYVGIFLGKITRWNDPLIAQDNPGVELPDRAITVVHRSDGSGTTAVFTQHLSAISPEWEKEIGAGTAVQWPANRGNFVGNRGNEGVTSLISQTQGSIGFIEYGFARKNNLSTAMLENQAGKFIAPGPESGSATLAKVELPENLRAFITDPAGEDSYPIVTYTWMLLYKKYDDPNKAIALEAMIQFGLTTGQEQAAQLGYIPLPQNVREKVAAAADIISPDFKITLPPAPTESK
jgi:phosphate transport system substrate-binding protein